MGQYETYPLLKSQVEERLDFHSLKNGGNGNVWLDCPCHRKKKARDQDFSYHKETGQYNCHAGNCGLSKSEGNCYDLARFFGIQRISDGSGSFKKDPTAGYPMKWDYRLEDGRIHSRVCRKEDVDPETGEIQKRYHTFYPENGDWVFSSKKENKPEPVLFNLPKLVSNETTHVLIVEGEKCAERLQKEIPSGYVATTCPGGSKRWKESFNKYLVGKRVFIIPDNDKAGEDHATVILKQNVNHPRITLAKPEKLGIKEGEDIYDWLEAGNHWKAGKGSNPSLESYLKKLESEMVKSASPTLGLAMETIEEKEKIREINTKASEEGSRLRFLSLFGDQVKWVPNSGKNGDWYFWNGIVWEKDREAKIYEKAREVVKVVWEEIKASTDAVETQALLAHWKSLSIHKRLKNLLEASGNTPGVMKELESFDCQPKILACKNTYLDLETVSPTEPTREDLITKQIPVDYDSEATCPKFQAFLERSQPDPEIRLLLQKIAGACLTGEVHYNHVFFFYGETGGNGKSVFLDVLFHVLGTYAVKGGASLVDATAKESMDDLARLKGARLVVPPETNRGAILRGNQIKEITGGELIKAEFKFQTGFQFRPEFTVIQFGNHKPMLDPTDGGIRRRIVLIPWEQTFTPDSPGYVDRGTLERELKSEASGILNWMLEGLWMVKNDSWNFQVPKVVLDATEDYFEEEDRLSDFLDECLVHDQETRDQRNLPKIYKAYEIFTRENGQKPLSSKNFVKELSRKKDIVLYKPDKKTRGIQGFNLTSEWENRVNSQKTSEDFL